MGLKSLIHIGFDLTLVAMLLAAVRRNTGYVFAYERYEFSSFIKSYLQWGEFCYKRFVGYVKRSQMFRFQLPNFDQFINRIEETFGGGSNRGENGNRAVNDPRSFEGPSPGADYVVPQQQ